MSGPLRVCLYEHSAGWVVVLVGELDIATAPVLTGALDQSDGGARPYVVADLSGLEFCDWSGIAALLRIHKRAVGQGGWLRLFAPSASMRKLLRITGQSKVLTWYAGIDEAFADPSALAAPPRLVQTRERNAGYVYDPDM